MRFFKDLDFLLPSTTTTTLERDESDIARVSATLDRIEKHRERVSAEFRDPVSNKYKYVEPYLEQLESFADRLIRENVAKQAEPDNVARRVRKFNRDILKEVGLSRVPSRTAPPSFEPSKWQTAWVGSRRVDEFPRTVFGTEAYTKRHSVSWIGNRLKHAMHVNPRFVSKLIALPCVERQTRKEVLFARDKAGRGYHGRRRRSKFADIWC